MWLTLDRQDRKYGFGVIALMVVGAYVLMFLNWREGNARLAVLQAADPTQLSVSIFLEDDTELENDVANAYANSPGSLVMLHQALTSMKRRKVADTKWRPPGLEGYFVVITGVGEPLHFTITTKKDRTNIILVRLVRWRDTEKGYSYAVLGTFTSEPLADWLTKALH